MIFITDWCTFCSLIIAGARLLHGLFSKILGGGMIDAPDHHSGASKLPLQQRCSLLLSKQVARINVKHYVYSSRAQTNTHTELTNFIHSFIHSFAQSVQKQQ